MFNNLKHPSAITGSLLVLGGATTNIVGSEINNNNYQPTNTTKHVGIGMFTARAILFTVFSRERNEKK